MSPDTARFLLDLLHAQTLNVGAPDFEEAVGRVIRARGELLAIVSEPLPGDPAHSP